MPVGNSSFARLRYAGVDYTISPADPPASPLPSPSPLPNESDNESWGTDDQCDETNNGHNNEFKETEGNDDEDSDIDAWSVPEVTSKPNPPLSSAALEYYHKPWDVMYLPPMDENPSYQHKAVTTVPAHINLKFSSPSPNFYLPPLPLSVKPDGKMTTIGEVYQAIHKYFHAQENIQALRDLGKSDADINVIRKRKQRMGDKFFDRFAKIDLLDERRWVQSFTVETSSDETSNGMVTWSVEMTRDSSD